MAIIASVATIAVPVFAIPRVVLCVFPSRRDDSLYHYQPYERATVATLYGRHGDRNVERALRRASLPSSAPSFPIVTSGDCAADPTATYTQPGNLKDAMRVLQLKVPLLFKYSVVYQKVQSSTGSTVMLL